MPWVLKKQARKTVLFLYPTWNQYFILKNEVTLVRATSDLK